MLAPKKDARFLGIRIDSRLSFAAHVKAVKGKMETQMHALTRLAASTWGCDLIRAREIYVKVIRAAMAYGAGATHNPNHPKVARGLQASQNKGLRKVLRAYKATPTRNLELEAFCPPLDLYFNKRLTDFEARLKASDIGAKIKRAC